MLPSTLEHRASWADVIGWGAVAGLIGGIAMAMLLMIVGLARGADFWSPLYLMAAFFNPAWAHLTGFAIGPLLAGMLLHLFGSALFGIIFAVLVRFVLPKPVSLAVAILLGLAFGLFLLLFITFAILPGVDVPLVHAVTHDGASFAWWIIGYLVYGGILGAVFGESNAAELPSPISEFGPRPSMLE